MRRVPCYDQWWEDIGAALAQELIDWANKAPDLADFSDYVGSSIEDWANDQVIAEYELWISGYEDYTYGESKDERY